MGYLFLAIALLTGATKGYCGKRTSRYVNEYKDAMLANFFRMLFCVVIGLVIAVFQGGIGSLQINAPVLTISLISGIASSVFVVTWLISVKNGAYVMMDVFLMLGIILPLIGSYILFKEDISIIQCAGIILLIFASLIMCSYNNSIKGKMTFVNLIILIICGISSGFVDFSQKMFIELESNVSIGTFNLYTYSFASILLGLCFIFTKRSNDVDAENTFHIKKILVYVIIMSVCLFANSFFQTQAAIYLPSAQLYPLSKGCALILSLLMSALFFKERISVKCVTGMIMAFVALLLINL